MCSWNHALFTALRHEQPTSSRTLSSLAGVTPSYYDNLKLENAWDGFRVSPNGALLEGTRYFQSYGRFGDGRSPPQTLLRNVVLGSRNLYVCREGGQCTIPLANGGDVTFGLCK